MHSEHSGDQSDRERDIAEAWRSYMTTGRVPEHMPQPWYNWPKFRRFVRHLPSAPRCQICYFPFEGAGGKAVKALLGVRRSPLNPRMCNICERFAESYPGGTEMEMSLLFADVRGSTALAETMSALEFSRLIDRFYRATTDAIFDRGGMVEKLVGDEVAAFFVPAFSSPNHARAAVDTGLAILSATGHGTSGRPWLSVGVGIHTGEAYVGSVGEKGGALDIVVLGDNVNVAARLASVAGPGEIVLSEATRSAAGLEPGDMERRSLDLKGKAEAVEAWVRSLHAPEPG